MEEWQQAITFPHDDLVEKNFDKSKKDEVKDPIAKVLRSDMLDVPAAFMV